MTEPLRSLVLRLAGPLQSWGGQSQFNRRDTLDEPTKSGILGLLAAAQGRRRQDPIEDLLELSLGVRTDQPGTLLRDYHTVSDYRGRPLLSASVSGRGVQKPTSPAKYTHVTERFYLQDAVFVAAVAGPTDTLRSLAAALLAPAFPLALGRRSCPPTQPLLIRPAEPGSDAILWDGGPRTVLKTVPWQISDHQVQVLQRRGNPPATVQLPITVDIDIDIDAGPGTDAAKGWDVRTDVPSSFDPLTRTYGTRRVGHAWAELPTPFGDTGSAPSHDPFALLGW